MYTTVEYVLQYVFVCVLPVPCSLPPPSDMPFPTTPTPFLARRYSSAFPVIPPLLASVASEEALGVGGTGTGRGGVPWRRDEVVEVLLEAARQVENWERMEGVNYQLSPSGSSRLCWK